MRTASPSVPHSPGCSLTPPQAGSNQSVVWLRGEHDLATKEELTRSLMRAVALDEPSVIIDLSEVQFISAATIGVMGVSI